MHIGALLTKHARYRPHHLAVVFDDTRLTYRVFNQQVNRLANVLVDLGIRKGEKITTFLPNCRDVTETLGAPLHQEHTSRDFLRTLWPDRRVLHHAGQDRLCGQTRLSRCASPFLCDADCE